MTISRFLSRCIGVAVVPLMISSHTFADESGRTVIQRNDAKEDVYLAGESVYQLGKIEGDVIAAGGQVTIEKEVTGYVLAAGGNVTVNGNVGNDVRAAGGRVVITGAVEDDVTVAGGFVSLDPMASVGGRAWFAGRNVELYGKVGKGIRAAGRSVIIGGEIKGNVEIMAETVEIRPDTVITGNLRYRSPNEAVIDPTAKIGGSVSRDEWPGYEKKGIFAKVLARIGFYLALAVTAIALYLLFPLVSTGATRNISTSPWKSLAVGIALLFATPLAIALLFVTIIGIPLALIAVPLYVMLLLAGYLIGAFYVGNISLGLINKTKKRTKTGPIWSILAGLLALLIVGFIPLLGALAVFITLLLGIGGLGLELGRRYSTAR